MANANPSNAGRETGVRVSTDPAELDLDWLVPALSERAYWALGRPRATVEAAIRESLCFGAYDDADGGRQVGFARVVTDQAVYGWVCDVFVDESARGRGVGSALMAAITTDPRLAGCRLTLSTSTAAGLYARHGFQPLAHPELMMERPGARRTADEEPD
jgi:GNAT superfamily N-acetyltransferase